MKYKPTFITILLITYTIIEVWMVLIGKKKQETSQEGWVVLIWLINPRRTKLSKIIFVTKVGVY